MKNKSLYPENTSEWQFQARKTDWENPDTIMIYSENMFKQTMSSYKVLTRSQKGDS